MFTSPKLIEPLQIARRVAMPVLSIEKMGPAAGFGSLENALALHSAIRGASYNALKNRLILASGNIAEFARVPALKR